MVTTLQPKRLATLFLSYSILLLGIAFISSPIKASVFDFADKVIDEVEPNDDQAQDLTNEFGEDILALGIAGDITDPNDVDQYLFPFPSSGKLELRCELFHQGVTSITAMRIGEDYNPYLISENNLWRFDTDLNTIELLATSDQIASAAEVEPANLQVRDLAVFGESSSLHIALSLVGSGDILWYTPDNGVSIGLSEETITNLTGQDQVQIVSVIADPSRNVYAADQASGCVIQASDSFSETVIYTSKETLHEALRTALLDNTAEQAITQMSTTVIAETEEAFTVNSLVLGSAGYAEEGYRSFYLTQLGADYNGDGSITRVRIDLADPNEVTFDKLFDPDESQSELNPSALALDTSGDFEYKMFMGTFGASLGDLRDGQVYKVDENGTASEFVTTYVDSEGGPVEGFFDVTDMAFGPGGDFGTDLYVISENINSSGSGYSSDLWRIGPDGVAELLIEGAADGLITLAFDETGKYGNALYVASFYTGKVYRIDNDFTIELFYDFTEYLDGAMACDMAFVPSGSPLAGAMVLTLKGSSNAILVELEPDGETVHTWATNLNTGDVSSGDIVFDDQQNLIIAHQSDKTLVHINYQDLFTYILLNLQIRPDDSGVFALLSAADKLRIFQLSDSGLAEDVIAAVRPTEVDMNPNGSDDTVAFAFDDEEHIYLYVNGDQNLQMGYLYSSNGEYYDFTDVLSGTTLDEATGLTNTEISFMGWAANQNLFAVGASVIDPEDDPNNHSLILLGNTGGAAAEPELLLPATELRQVTLNIQGEEGIDQTYTVRGAEVLKQSIAGLVQGDYFVTLSDPVGLAGDYELLLSIGELETTITVDADTAPLIITDTQDRQYVLDYTGPGRAELFATQKPGEGKIVDFIHLTIYNSTSQSQLYFGDDLDFDIRDKNALAPDSTDPNTPLSLEEIILNGSLKGVYYNGIVDGVTADDERNYTVRKAFFSQVKQMDAGTCRFGELRVEYLGDPNTADNPFNIYRIGNLYVDQDINNVAFDAKLADNDYNQVYVGGVIQSSVFYGRKIKTLEVVNQEGDENAISDSTFNITFKQSSIKEILVHQGNVDRCTFKTFNTLGHFEVRDGDLIDTLLTGNKFLCLYVSGEISGGSISVRQSSSSKIFRLICGGSCDGSISTTRLNEIWVGYDFNLQRLEDSDPNAVADLTGSISSSYAPKQIVVTGKMDGATITCSFGKLESIFAEDGLNDVYIYAPRIQRIVLGYRDGRRSLDTLVNEEADFSGTISARSLARFYYTGTMDSSAYIPLNVGHLQDDVP